MIGPVKNVCRCRRTWGGSPSEELLWALCGPHPHFPNSPRSRAQCWGTEELASTASFSLVRAGLISILRYATDGFYNALNIDAIPKKSGITAYLVTQSAGSVTASLHRTGAQGNTVKVASMCYCVPGTLFSIVMGSAEKVIASTDHFPRD